jgi:hypothetical protein
MQRIPEQRERALALLERMAWGDMDGYIGSLEAALRSALEVTTEDFQRWEITSARSSKPAVSTSSPCRRERSTRCPMGTGLRT